MDKSNWNKPLIDVLSSIFDNGDVPSNGECDIMREIASENIIDGNRYYALGQIKSQICSAFASNKFPTTDLNAVRFYDISKGKSLYYILDAINKKQLTIGKVNFNDVHDPLIAVFARLMKNKSKDHWHKEWYRLLIEACGNLRISCLCPTTLTNCWGLRKDKAILNELMWAHYAHCHTGICVEYEVKKETFDKINQSSCEKFCFVSKVDYSNDIVPLEEVTIHNALLMKSKKWEYEHEYRIIYYDSEHERDYIPIPVEIKGVYLGAAIDNDKAKCIMQKLQLIGIPVYRMIFNEKDLLNLRFVKK